MSKNQKAWFQSKSNIIDPGLRQQLQMVRGLGASQTTTIPVIVKFKPGEQMDSSGLSQITSSHTSDCWDGEIPLLHGFYGRLHPSTIQSLADQQSISRIYYDREVKSFLDIALKSTGARDVQLQEGYTGKGITIAIVDTGIYPHPDLTQPNHRIIAFQDFVNKRTEPYDDQGHGTHCAGDAAGNGKMSEGLYMGPAPEAHLVGVKVLDAQGSGRLSTVIKGIEWCIEKRKEYNIRVISLSLGSPAMESYRDDPLAQAVEKAWHHGIVVCAAAGNEGPDAGTISTPGNDPIIITVGAADDKNTEGLKDDEKASFSSRGPTNDGLVKPDLYAPGTDIISLLSPGSTIEKELPENKVGDPYIRLSSSIRNIDGNSFYCGSLCLVATSKSTPLTQ